MAYRNGVLEFDHPTRSGQPQENTGANERPREVKEVPMKTFVMQAIDRGGFMDRAFPNPAPPMRLSKPRWPSSALPIHTLSMALSDRARISPSGTRPWASCMKSDLRCASSSRAIASSRRDRSRLGRSILAGGTFLAIRRRARRMEVCRRQGWRLRGVFPVNDANAKFAKIPAHVSDDAAVYCADMLSTGLVGAEAANIPIGGSVAMFALGPVGLMAVAGARLRGAERSSRSIRCRNAASSPNFTAPISPQSLA